MCTVVAVHVSQLECTMNVAAGPMPHSLDIGDPNLPIPHLIPLSKFYDAILLNIGAT